MDRAEAIKRLEWLRMVGRHVDSVTLGAEDMGYFDMAITALREQEQSRWISVEEKPMPSNNDEYEVCCNYHGEKRIEIHKGWNTHCVTHWRKLPKPPKEGAEG